jgi:hypothetical protein
MNNTPHGIYEKLMQEVPRFDATYSDKGRNEYYKRLNKVILDMELGEARKSIERAIKIYFGESDDLFFRSYMHRKRFCSFYKKAEVHKWSFIQKNHYIAALYLLFADSFFERFFPNIVDNNRINLTNINLKETDEDIYNLYQAACFICNGKDSLNHEDFINPEILKERIMALIINAFVINKYGIMALIP